MIRAPENERPVGDAIGVDMAINTQEQRANCINVLLAFLSSHGTASEAGITRQCLPVVQEAMIRLSSIDQRPEVCYQWLPLMAGRDLNTHLHYLIIAIP